MSARLVSRLAATAAASGLVAFGIGMAVPSGTAVAEPLNPCLGSAGVAAADPSAEPESFGSCESARDSCLAMHSKEDVWGNRYTPPDDYSMCMQAYWNCRKQQ